MATLTHQEIADQLAELRGQLAATMQGINALYKALEDSQDTETTHVDTTTETKETATEKEPDLLPPELSRYKVLCPEGEESLYCVTYKMPKKFALKIIKSAQESDTLNPFDPDEAIYDDGLLYVDGELEQDFDIVVTSAVRDGTLPRLPVKKAFLVEPDKDNHFLTLYEFLEDAKALPRKGKVRSAILEELEEIADVDFDGADSETMELLNKAADLTVDSDELEELITLAERTLDEQA